MVSRGVVGNSLNDPFREYMENKPLSSMSVKDLKRRGTINGEDGIYGDEN